MQNDDFNIKIRLAKFLKYKKISQGKFAELAGVSKGYANNIGKSMRSDKAMLIEKAFPDLNIDWLLYEKGGMLKQDANEENNDIQFYEPENRPSGKRLIPLWDDINTIGGRNKIANISTSSQPSEWIDPGDWFKSATHAIRHYDESMKEYPSGCILALKEVKDRNLLIPGKDYVIETSEYRVTKKLGKSDRPNHIRAYSTNEEKRFDGTLIHDWFDVDDSLINAYYEVLGYVVKKGSGTIVFSNQK